MTAVSLGVCLTYSETVGTLRPPSVMAPQREQRSLKDNLSRHARLPQRVGQQIRWPYPCSFTLGQVSEFHNTGEASHDQVFGDDVPCGHHDCHTRSPIAEPVVIQSWLG